ncbi:MAG: hypothetical protein V5A57_01095 [Candidatus Paceibacterota bacterium]
MLALEFELNQTWLREEEKKIKGAGKSTFPDYYEAGESLKEKEYDVFESERCLFGIPISLIVIGENKQEIKSDVFSATGSFRYSLTQVHKKA